MQFDPKEKHYTRDDAKFQEIRKHIDFLLKVEPKTIDKDTFLSALNVSMNQIGYISDPQYQRAILSLRKKLSQSKKIPESVVRR